MCVTLCFCSSTLPPVLSSIVFSLAFLGLAFSFHTVMTCLISCFLAPSHITFQGSFLSLTPCFYNALLFGSFSLARHFPTYLFLPYFSSLLSSSLNSPAFLLHLPSFPLCIAKRVFFLHSFLFAIFKLALSFLTLPSTTLLRSPIFPPTLSCSPPCPQLR